jgi:hypothetical protein
MEKSRRERTEESCKVQRINTGRKGKWKGRIKEVRDRTNKEKLK